MRFPHAKLVLAAALCAVPLQGQEQETRRLVPESRLIVAPHLGIRSSFLGSGESLLVVPGRVFPVVLEMEPERSVGGTAGVDVDLRLAGRLGVSVAVAYTGSDRMVLTSQSERGPISQLAVTGPAVTVARAGLSYRFPEPPGVGSFPAGYLLVGPAWVRRDYEGTVLLGEGAERVESWGAAIGYRALWPIGSSRVFLQTTLEDYVIFWGPEGESDRLAPLMDLAGGRVLGADLGYDRTHVPHFSVGLALRM